MRIIERVRMIERVRVTESKVCSYCCYVPLMLDILRALMIIKLTDSVRTSRDSSEK